MQRSSPYLKYVPGLLLCAGVTLAALGVEHLEARVAGRAWIEALVLAILIGTLVRTAWKPPTAHEAGIHFAATTMLEVAVMLMGVTVSFGSILSAGPRLLTGIVVTVFLTIAATFALGRVLGLPRRMALLIACGNAICGNSAIAAVAPVIDAESDDVGTAIAFTAVLGIAVVLLLPLIAARLQLGAPASGALAGLTVYAVPQVLAAATPMGPVAVQLGTLVKLVRVLMLGPVVVVLALLNGRTQATSISRQGGAMSRLLPGFILMFLALAALRSTGLIPDAWVQPAHIASNGLTIIAMAGLGLGVDLRHVTSAGPRVSLTVTLSLLLLGAVAFLVIRLSGLT